MEFAVQGVIMKKASIELISATVINFMVTLLGGADDLLKTMIIFIIVDMVTGILKALVNKDLSSVAMYSGVIKKLTMFLVIILGVRIDLMITSITDSPITLFNHPFYVRNYFIIFLIINESLSTTENLYEIGVPFPHWVSNLLRTVAKTTDGEVPKPLVDWLSSKGIKVTSEGKLKNDSEENKSKEDNPKNTT